MLRYTPIYLTLGAFALFSNPKNAQIVKGSADISQNAHLLEVSVADGTIIDWKEFSIQPQEITRFLQPNESARVLNRVTGSANSSLLGTLQANGQVYLMNPHGVIIGKDAHINTQGLFLTTFEIDEDLFHKSIWLLKGETNGAIVNTDGQLCIDPSGRAIARKIY